MLWTIIHPGIQNKVGYNQAMKLPYWRRGFDSEKESSPRLLVVARRLDGPAPLSWSPWASAAKAIGNDTPSGMAMVTGLDIPSAGCWEISAHYEDQTLTFTMLVHK